jgi:solute carrier family 25 protein 38
MKVALIKDIPFAAIYYPLYEDCKKFFKFSVGGMDTPGKLIYVSFMSASMANLISCIVTHPLDIMRTRVIFQFYNSDKNQHYTGVFDAMKKMYTTDGGVRGFFRGLTPRILRKGAANIIAWTLYEFLIDRRKHKIDLS